MQNTQNATRCYDFTLKVQREREEEGESPGQIEPETLVSFFKKSGLFTKWCFQKEVGKETGYVHYQGRFSLAKKERKRQLMGEWEKTVLDYEIPFPNYCEPTVKSEMVGGKFAYMTKLQTCVAGPWSDKDVDAAPEYVPLQYRVAEGDLWEVTKQIMEISKIFDSRKVNVIVDKAGGNAKSFTAHRMALMQGAVILPPEDDYSRIIASAQNMLSAKNIRQNVVIFMDMSRAMKKNELYKIYSAIEIIKNGHVYDTRNHYKDWWFDSPVIWVFTNTDPDHSLLSRDRWVLWTIKDRALAPYVANDPHFLPVEV